MKILLIFDNLSCNKKWGNLFFTSHRQHETRFTILYNGLISPKIKLQRSKSNTKDPKFIQN